MKTGPAQERRARVSRAPLYLFPAAELRSRASSIKGAGEGGGGMSMLDRRSFLKIAAGAAIAGRVRPLLAGSCGFRKVKGVIWLWMDGGLCPGHTWDPKPDSPSGCRVKAIATAAPGIQVSELLPVCASQMNHLAIIRSLTHGFGHDEMATLLMHVGHMPGQTTDLAPIGTLLAQELGAKDFPLPKYVSIGGPSVPERPQFGEDSLPFLVNGNNLSNPIPNLRRNVDSARDRSRAELLLDQNREWDARRKQREIERLESAYVRSEAIMNTPLLKAFNILEEPALLRAEYGEGFGQHCLVARRLVQAGCPFVEIGLEGWGRKSCRSESFFQRVKSLDQGLGTLVKDLAQKEMLEDTPVLWAAPFGKPPAQDQADDHRLRAFSVVLAGGFLQGGIVYGDTGPEGKDCRSPVSVRDFFATVYCASGVNWDKEYRTEMLLKRTYASGGWPVEDLF